MRYLTSLILTFCIIHAAAAASSAPEAAELYFISPADGASDSSPVTIRFGLRNMGVAPAGTQADNTGHHHLLINTDLPALDRPIPNDDQHRHFGLGQTETTLDLPAGEHTLQLLLGNFAHIPHEPAVKSEQIRITVTD
ncbi:MAG: DUF4399 domain-containing protein [Gammaproteobacteria bacterium]